MLELDEGVHILAKTVCHLASIFYHLENSCNFFSSKEIEDVIFLGLRFLLCVQCWFQLKRSLDDLHDQEGSPGGGSKDSIIWFYQLN